MARDARLFENELTTCGPEQCRKTEWQAIVDNLRGKDIMTQLREINTEMNKRPYITDQVNWNLPDYWATPLQFLQKGGDCEDFAIAKYMALRAPGVPVEDMRIVVLNDLNLGIAHAVLAVYVNAGPYILDNQISKVVPASTIRHYQPVYSINENGWWLHRNGGSEISSLETIRCAKARPRKFSEKARRRHAAGGVEQSGAGSGEPGAAGRQRIVGIEQVQRGAASSGAGSRRSGGRYRRAGRPSPASL